MTFECSLDDLDAQAYDHTAFIASLRNGMRVRVARKVMKEPGWDNRWIERMDNCIGFVGTIYMIADHGIYFEEFDLGFPPGSLAPIDEQEQLPLF